MERDLISVIIPVYNVEKYLHRCIDSVLQQRYNNIEILLVDDGSTDSSKQICDEYAKLDKRVQALHTENRGVSRARNAGIDIMQGKWVTFLDSDDYISDDFIETLHNLCIKNNSNISCGGFETTKVSDFDFKKVNDEKHIKEENFTGAQAIANVYGKNEGKVFIIPWNKMYSSTVFQDYRFKKDIIHEDDELVWKLLYNAKKISTTNKTMYAYYMAPNSITRGAFNNKSLVYLDIIQERLDFLKSKEEDELYDLTLKSKCYALQDYYCKCKAAYPQEKELYNNMRKEFLSTYPQAIKSKYIPLKSKLCLFVMRVSPKAYQTLRG